MPNSSVGLIEEWSSWRLSMPPHVFGADRYWLSSRRSAGVTVVRTGWQEAFTADDFCAPGDTRLDLGLLPQPFFGDLRRASVFLLLLNPGLGPDDYYGEYEVPAFRAAMLANLKQDVSATGHPFLFLDPQFSWHGGFDWWHSKLAQVIQRLANGWSVSFAAARSRLAAAIASIELFPYHSASFRDADHWLRNLSSVELARAYVRDVVIPRVRGGDAILIVTRKAREWGIPAQDGVVVYGPAEARAAHLTPESPGGQAILRHLLGRRSPDP